MPSPFPGMDPWLEGEETFPDLHDGLTYLFKEVLNAALPAGYVATTRNRVWVDPELRREPDVSVFGRDRNGRPGFRPADGGVALAVLDRTAGLVAVPAPPAEVHQEPYLEIRSAGGKRLVTVVEVLGRANKRPGDGGRDAYLAKQAEYRASGVSAVEIDLLRGGPHTTAVPLDPARRAAGDWDYHACVFRGESPEDFEVYPIRLPQRLPAVAVPLRPEAAPVRVDLQAVFDRCYDAGLYARRVDYRLPPDPPLTPDPAAWAAGVLRSRGLTPPPEG